MLQELLSKYSTQAEQQAYLQQLVEDHPFFTPAHFSLLQLTPVEAPAYAQRAATTALLFNNTGWLNYQLHHQFKNAAAMASPEIIIPAAGQQDGMAPLTATIPEQKILMPQAETALSPQAEGVAAELQDEANTPAAATITATADADEVTPVQQPNTNNTEVTAAMDTTIAPLPIPGPGKHDSELLFEPLYAVDYFASQGIKLSEDLQPGDKLAKQLKSFTEWLKSMKKTQAQAAEAQATAGNDPAIQYIAEKSNKEGDVVTEAMALVYAQQGNIKKAIGIYKKLSLLNPPKSAYFAAKIDNLK